MKTYFSIFSLVFLLILMGCDTESHDRFKVGTTLWGGYEPLHLAQERGFFGTHAIDLIELTSAPDVIRAMKNGSIQAATLTLDETIGLLVSGVDVSAILVMDVSQGADVVISRNPLTSLNDVEGMHIGVETGGVGAIMLASFLEYAGLTVSDINVVQLSEQLHLTAFEKFDVDLLVTTEPTAGQLVQSGAHSVFDSTNIPNRISDVLVVRKEFLKRYSGHIQQLVTGYFSARRIMEKTPEVALSSMVERTGIAYDDITRIYRGLHLPSLEENRIWLSMCERYLGDRVKQLSLMMVKQDLIDFAPDNPLICDSSWVNGVSL